MGKKIIAVLVMGFVIFYLIFVTTAILQVPLHAGLNFESLLVLLVAFVMAFLIYAALATLFERFKEIDEEDHDDLSKY